MEDTFPEILPTYVMYCINLHRIRSERLDKILLSVADDHPKCPQCPEKGYLLLSSLECDIDNHKNCPDSSYDSCACDCHYHGAIVDEYTGELVMESQKEERSFEIPDDYAIDIEKVIEFLLDYKDDAERIFRDTLKILQLPEDLKGKELERRVDNYVRTHVLYIYPPSSFEMECLRMIYDNDRLSEDLMHYVGLLRYNTCLPYFEEDETERLDQS